MSINTEDIAQMIRSELGDADVRVQGADAKYQIQVIADEFAGLNAVKRQQRIYRIINPYISTGEIHAVSMLLKTHEEHQAM
jgi:acid stress-induced BolA-like protein IbaG/YrbA